MDRKKLLVTIAVFISAIVAVSGLMKSRKPTELVTNTSGHTTTAPVPRDTPTALPDTSPEEPGHLPEPVPGQSRLPAPPATSLPATAQPLNMKPATETSPGRLLEHASPETSAMTLYTYDGDTVRIANLFDSAGEQRILDIINSTRTERVTDWSPDKATLPVYGIEVGDRDGYSIFAAWTNGQWIFQDGSVYQMDFDFQQLSQIAKWEDAGELPSFTSFPCARVMTQVNDSWNKRFLVPAAPLDPPGGVTMKLDSWNQDTAEVTISNKSGKEWGCGEFYELQVLLEGVWYEIPTVPGNWGFNCMGYYVPDGEAQGMVNHLSMYGKLPPGVYRLVLSGLSVEHKIQ